MSRAVFDATWPLSAMPKAQRFRSRVESSLALSLDIFAKMKSPPLPEYYGQLPCTREDLYRSPRGRSPPWRFRSCLRQALGLPAHGIQQGYKSCAVVGSSGSLLMGRWGGEIDQHEVVIRFNNAPVTGYEEIAGARGSVRMLNSNAMSSLLQQCAAKNSCAANYSCCPVDTALILNSEYTQLVDCIRAVCGKGTPLTSGMKDSVMRHRVFQEFDRQRLKNQTLSGQRLPSGVYGLALAQLLCADETNINAYGFSLGTTQATRYHYYDRCDHERKDALESVASMTASVHHNFPIRFHQPSDDINGNGSLREWAPKDAPPREVECPQRNTAKKVAMARAARILNGTICRAGIKLRFKKSHFACCSASCGKCSGVGCNNRPGGKSQCCALNIRMRGQVCNHPDATGCLFVEKRAPSTSRR